MAYYVSMGHMKKFVWLALKNSWGGYLIHNKTFQLAVYSRFLPNQNFPSRRNRKLIFEKSTQNFIYWGESLYNHHKLTKYWK